MESVEEAGAPMLWDDNSLTETQVRLLKRIGATAPPLESSGASRISQVSARPRQDNDIHGGRVTVDWAGMEHGHPRFEVRVTMADSAKVVILWKRFYEFRDLSNQASVDV